MVILRWKKKKWIEKIKNLKKNMEASNANIQIIDYGAGISGSQYKQQKGASSEHVLNRIVGDVCKKASQPYLWSLLLFKIIREIKPQICLELGTCLGISASYQAAALKLNTSGKILTLEGAESLAAIASQNFSTLGLDNVNIVIGCFQDTLKSTLSKLGHIDFVFIDGHHNETATLQYFEQISHSLSKKAILVFDDISWSAEMKRAWNNIIMDKRIKISFDLHKLGICIVDEDIKDAEKFKLFLI